MRCSTEALRRIRIAVVPIAATPPLQSDQGWLYELLRWAGVSQQTAVHWQRVIIRPGTVVVVVALAFLIGWLGSRIIRRWVGAAALKATARAGARGDSARAATLTAMAANIWRAVVGVTAFFIVLGTIGVNLTPLLAGATVIGATIGFGAQSMVRDLLAGFLLTVEGQYDIGDTILVGDTGGTVEDLTLRITRLRAYDGTVWFVPNGEIRKLANSTRGWALAAVDVPVPAATDVDTALSAIRAGAEAVAHDPQHSSSCLEPPRVWGVVAADADTFTIRVSVRTPLAARDALSRALRQDIVRALHAAGAFPSTVAPASAPQDGASGDAEDGSPPRS